MLCFKPHSHRPGSPVRSRLTVSVLKMRKLGQVGTLRLLWGLMEMLQIRNLASGWDGVGAQQSLPIYNNVENYLRFNSYNVLCGHRGVARALEHYFNNSNREDMKFFTFILFIHKPAPIQLHFWCPGLQPPERLRLLFLSRNNSVALTPTCALAAQIKPNCGWGSRWPPVLWRAEKGSPAFPHPVPGLLCVHHRHWALYFST